MRAADRRLAHELAAGVLRAQHELDAALAPLVRGNWARTPEALKDLLRVGAYQLVRLARVPPYAAVQTTVEVAKRAHGRRWARLVNAVLRRVAAAPSRPATGGLAARYSHPAWLVKRWLARFGPERTETLLAHNNRRPPLTIQPVRWTPEQLEAALSQAGVPHQPAPWGAGITVTARDVTHLPGYGDGAFIVQDAGQAHLLAASGVPDGAVVWDACAAPGGKTVMLSGRCQVIASEYRRRRVPRLRETLRRTGVAVPLLLADARRPPLRPGAVDLTLIDAPCSATGTIARHPDARWRLTRRRLAWLSALQAAILDGAAATVRPGGLLVYLTCSLEREENEDQVGRFLTLHPDFRQDGEAAWLFPPDTGTDGGYAARLRRLG